MQGDPAPKSNGAQAVSKMAVSADYIQKCKSSFPSVLMAIRELLDNMLAPDKERNRPDAEGEPLKIEFFLIQGICLGGGEDSLGEPHDQLRMSGNGQPIPPKKVEDMLNLGHRSHVHRPRRAGGCPWDEMNAAMDTAASAAGEKIYGLFGHGSFLAVGALSYNAFWQCNHVDAQGKRTRWIALFGQAIVSDNQISHVVLSVPDGVSSEEEWRATCTTAGELAELEAKIDIMTQQKGPQRKGLDIPYFSPFNDTKELLDAFDEMGAKGETLRLDMLLAADTAPGSLKLQVHEHEMLDIIEENDCRYLRHEILRWYMPQNDSFALRQHLRPQHLRQNTPLPKITIQEQPVDWLHNDWQKRMDMPDTYIHPVDTIQHRTPFGDHDIKVMVLELKPSENSRESSDEVYGGLAVYLDSDRAIWSKPALPSEKLRASKEEYQMKLYRTRPNRTSYNMLLRLLDYGSEDEAVEGGLPTLAEFAPKEQGVPSEHLADARSRKERKDALYRLGSGNVEAYCMLDRRFVTKHNLLADSKDALADTKVVQEMYLLVMRHMARVTWQRYKREHNGPLPSLAQQMERCAEVSAGLQGLIKEEEEEGEEEVQRQPLLPPVRLKREVMSLLPSDGQHTSSIVTGPRKGCKQEPTVHQADSSCGAAAQQPTNDANRVPSEHAVQGAGSNIGAAGEAAHAAGASSAGVHGAGGSGAGVSRAGPGANRKRAALPDEKAQLVAQLGTALARLKKTMKDTARRPEEDKAKHEKREVTTLKKMHTVIGVALRKKGQK